MAYPLAVAGIGLTANRNPFVLYGEAGTDPVYRGRKASTDKSRTVVSFTPRRRMARDQIEVAFSLFYDPLSAQSGICY